MTPILDKESIARFRRKIWRFYKEHRRDLPFRRTVDPYCITVSEIMLQQTQVDRVVPKYEAWIKRWPDWQSLANASVQQLHQMWSGLGYNRRAVFLGRMARAVVEDHDGRLPDSPELLRKLPGIGPYTSHAILIFAFNAPLVTIDTNIRRVILHEFDLPATLSDGDLHEIARQLLPRGKSRDWHYALMDYSALVLPKQLKCIPPKTRQTRFEGSLRQIRGEIIRRLTSRRSVTVSEVAEALNRAEQDVFQAAEAMAREGLVTVHRGRIELCDDDS